MFMDSWEESHTGRRVLKAWRALLMRSSTSLLRKYKTPSTSGATSIQMVELTKMWSVRV